MSAPTDAAVESGGRDTNDHTEPAQTDPRRERLQNPTSTTPPPAGTGLFDLAVASRFKRRRHRDPEDSWTLPKAKYIHPSSFPFTLLPQTTLLAVQSIKRGTFDDMPATLVILSARHVRHRQRWAAFFRMNLDQRDEDGHSSWAIIAPYSVLLPARQQDQEGPVIQSTSSECDTLNVGVQHPWTRQVPHGIPYRVRYALIIRQEFEASDIRITVEDPRGRNHISRWRKAGRTETLTIESTLPSDPSLVTCGKREGQPCRADCANLHYDHLTEGVLRDLLFTPGDLEKYVIFTDSKMVSVSLLEHRSSSRAWPNSCRIRALHLLREPI